MTAPEAVLRSGLRAVYGYTSTREDAIAAHAYRLGAGQVVAALEARAELARGFGGMQEAATLGFVLRGVREELGL